MTFDAIYEKCFKSIYRYCFYRNGRDQYCAEEATKKTLDVAYEKWETVKSYENKQFISWLYGVAENKMKEVRREQLPTTEPLDEEWCRELVEQQQYKHGEPLDEEIEYQRFLQYAGEIEKLLKPKEQDLFHYRVVEKLSHRDIGEKMNLSENAVKLRWMRLQDKLHPIVEQLFDCK